jgi:hypothetical protein
LDQKLKRNLNLILKDYPKKETIFDLKSVGSFNINDKGSLAEFQKRRQE